MDDLVPLQVADAVEDPTTYFTRMNVPVGRVRRLEITAGNSYKLLHDADLHFSKFLVNLNTAITTHYF